MSLTAVLLGIIDIAILVLILLLIGAVILWFCTYLNFPVPSNVQKIYIAIVALVALVALISLLLGVPRFRIVAFAPTSAQAAIAPPLR
jgi:hypothetical protein